MGLLGKSFEEKVQEAIAGINAAGLRIKGLRADIEGKVVTLHGEAPSLDAKKRAMQEFNALVETENTLNLIAVAQVAVPATPVAAVPAPVQARVHEVVSGDTLSGIAQHYYGKASLYMKIFEANRDQLSDPNRIKVGQRLKIPE
jgi:LysM repeat protein